MYNDLFTDVDECLSSSMNNCSQECNNTEGSYLCCCKSGYNLDPSDNSTCHGIIYYTHTVILVYSYLDCII